MLFQNDFPVDVEDHVFIDEARRSLVGLALHKWLGHGVTSGHYVSICKRGAKWFLFDDGAVECGTAPSVFQHKEGSVRLSSFRTVDVPS